MSASASVEAQPAVAPAAQGAKITRLGGLKLRIKLPPRHPGLAASSPGPDGSQQPSTSGRSSLVHSSPSGAAAPAPAGHGVACAASGPAWDLNSAVSLMCNQGIRGLGAALLTPWHHTLLEPLQQDNKRARAVVSASAAAPTAKRQRLEGKGAAHAAAAAGTMAAQSAAVEPAAAAAAPGPARPSSAPSRRQQAVLTEDDFGAQAPSRKAARAQSGSPPDKQQQKRSQGNRARRRAALQLDDDDDDEVPHAANKSASLAPQPQAAPKPSAPPVQQQHKQQERQRQQQDNIQPKNGEQTAPHVSQPAAGGSPSAQAAEPAVTTGKRKATSAAAGRSVAAAPDGAPTNKRQRSASPPPAAAAPAAAAAAAAAGATTTATATAAVPSAAAAEPSAPALQVGVAPRNEPAPSVVVDSLIKPAAAAAPYKDEQQEQQQAEQPPQALVADSPAPAPVLVAPAPAPPAPGPSDQLCDFGPLPLSGAAAALGSVSLQPPKLERKSIAYITSVEEALPFLDALLEGAKKLKKSGDKGVHANHHWDVRSLAYYTLSGITFVEYAAYHAALQSQLRASGALVDAAGRPGVLPNPTPLLLPQTANMLSVAVKAISTAQGSDLAKQGMRMLMERLMAICYMRHLQQHQHHLRSHVHRVRQGVLAAQTGAAVPSAPQQPAQAATAQAATAPPAATSAKGGPAPINSSGKRRSPDDSLQSTQERLPDHQLAGSQQQQSANSSRGTPGAVAGGGAALTTQLPPLVMMSQGHVVSTMKQALHMADLMNQAVMRLQQFLERPEVQACEEAKQAAVHVSAVGLDAGMYSIDHVAAHARAAVRCLLGLDVAIARASAGAARRGV